MTDFLVFTPVSTRRTARDLEKFNWRVKRCGSYGLLPRAGIINCRPNHITFTDYKEWPVPIAAYTQYTRGRLSLPELSPLIVCF